eukprot:scaffold63425_cov60-Phaeocystis_antarctica.AAC.3
MRHCGFQPPDAPCMLRIAASAAAVASTQVRCTLSGRNGGSAPSSAGVMSACRMRSSAGRSGDWPCTSMPVTLRLAGPLYTARRLPS